MLISQRTKMKEILLGARVKCADFHPTEPLLLLALHTGKIMVWNLQTNSLTRTVDIPGSSPVRAARFIARKQWIVSGSDDAMIRVFDFETFDVIHEFKAHGDYIRDLQVHPSKPLLLSCADDAKVKVWDWDSDWQLRSTFEGHKHYVMAARFDPNDPNRIVSASLDGTLKVWHLVGSSEAVITLRGHGKGVNCCEFFPTRAGLLVSAADDCFVKVWDLNAGTCLKTLIGHTHNVSAVLVDDAHQRIVSAGEDGSVCVWDAETFELLANVNSREMARAWSLSVGTQHHHAIAVGYDEGFGLLSFQDGKHSETVGADVAAHSKLKSAPTMSRLSAL